MQASTTLLKTQILQSLIHDMLHDFNNMSYCLYNAEHAISNKASEKEASKMTKRAKLTLHDIKKHVIFFMKGVFWKSQNGFLIFQNNSRKYSHNTMQFIVSNTGLNENDKITGR